MDESKKIKNGKKRWGFVVEYMAENGMTETVEGVSAYYRSLKCRFYKAKCMAKKSGAGGVTFAHYKVCEEHFNRTDNHQLNPVAGCSTLRTEEGAAAAESSSDEDDSTPPPKKAKRELSVNERIVNLLEKTDAREEAKLDILRQACNVLQTLSEKLSK